MNVYKGRYSLIKKDLSNNDFEIFDFTSSIFDFISEKDNDSMTEVSLATIDSLTTVFNGAVELESYFNKKSVSKEEDLMSSISIGYQNKAGEAASLCVIWDDETLHKIASSANGGKVNLNDPTTNEVLHDMYYRLKDPSNGLADLLFNSSSNDTKVNDHNIRLIKASLNRHLDSTLYKRFTESFSSYREFRALYIAYKRNLAKMQKNKPQMLEKK